MLYLTKRQAEEIIEHSRREHPNEACGILAGKAVSGRGQKENRVEKIYRMVNADKSRTTFFMDPKEQLKTMKDIRNLGMEMVGIYHSHPDTKAHPSAHDVELAYYPELSYVIVSLRDKDKPEIESFRIVEGKIEKEGITYT